MEQLSADILRIQRFSINDGPGIRTTVFFKGCPLHCLWCHNPDSISREPQLLLSHKLCTCCGRCAAACPELHQIVGGKHIVHFERFATSRESSVEVCLAGALSIQGSRMSISEIMETVERDAHYYKESGGGITASGGEPMLQFHFLAGLFEAARNAGINTALDTSGYAPHEHFEHILPLTDCLLFDIKMMNSALHEHYTGVDNRLIIRNFASAVKHGAHIIVRHIVVPGINDSQAENAALLELLLDTGFNGTLELLPYHAMARAKYEDLGLQYTMGDNPVPTTEQMEQAEHFFVSKGINCKIN